MNTVKGTPQELKEHIMNLASEFVNNWWLKKVPHPEYFENAVYFGSFLLKCAYCNNIEELLSMLSETNSDVDVICNTARVPDEEILGFSCIEQYWDLNNHFSMDVVKGHQHILPYRSELYVFAHENPTWVLTEGTLPIVDWSSLMYTKEDGKFVLTSRISQPLNNVLQNIIDGVAIVTDEQTFDPLLPENKIWNDTTVARVAKYIRMNINIRFSDRLMVILDNCTMNDNYHTAKEYIFSPECLYKPKQ